MTVPHPHARWIQYAPTWKTAMAPETVLRNAMHQRQWSHAAYENQRILGENSHQSDDNLAKYRQ